MPCVTEAETKKALQTQQRILKALISAVEGGIKLQRNNSNVYLTFLFCLLNRLASRCQLWCLNQWKRRKSPTGSQGLWILTDTIKRTGGRGQTGASWCLRGQTQYAWKYSLYPLWATQNVLLWQLRWSRHSIGRPVSASPGCLSCAVPPEHVPEAHPILLYGTQLWYILTPVSCSRSYHA